MSGQILNDGVNVLDFDSEGDLPEGRMNDTDEPEPLDTGFDPGDYNIDEVKAHVEANPDDAERVADAERGGKGRVRLLAWLDEFQNDKPAGVGAGDTSSEEN